VNVADKLNYQKKDIVKIPIIASKADRKMHKKANDLRHTNSEAFRLNEKFRGVL
jgi:hypothetical protein